MEPDRRTLKKYRSFLITCNQPDLYLAEIFEYLRSFKTKDYMIAGEEIAPTTGHKHVHIYVHFRNTVRLNLEKMHNPDCRGCRGTPQQNIEYVSKDGKIVLEEGTRPKQGGLRIGDVENMKPSEIKDLPIQYYNIVEKIKAKKAVFINVDDLGKEIEVYYISGQSGLGKTELAKKIIKKLGYTKVNMVKFEAGFWHNVSSEGECMLYDDWRDSHMKPSEFINMIDYNKHPMNIKGGTVMNNYRCVIITTILKLEDIYSSKSEEDRLQWERRITKNIHFTGEKIQTKKNNFKINYETMDNFIDNL